MDIAIASNTTGLVALPPAIANLLAASITCSKASLSSLLLRLLAKRFQLNISCSKAILYAVVSEVVKEADITTQL